MWDTCTSYFWPKKFDRVGRGGQRRSKYGPEWASLLYIFGLGAFLKPLNGSRTPETDPKWSRRISELLTLEMPTGGQFWLPLIDLSPFPGSPNHLGVSKGLWSQTEATSGADFDLSWPPCQPCKMFLVRNGSYRCHIVLHISYSTDEEKGFFSTIAFPQRINRNGRFDISRLIRFFFTFYFFRRAVGTIREGCR